MKKSLTLILSIIIVLTLLNSCSGGNAETSTAVGQTEDITTGAAVTTVTTAAESTAAEITSEESTAEETKAEPVSFNLADAQFRIITSASAGSSTLLTNSMTALVNKLKTMSQLKYVIQTDTSAQDNDGAVEIVIGNSTRAESSQLYNTLGPLDYSVSVVGYKILLVGGSADATAKAVSWFMTNCLFKSVTGYTEGVLYTYTSDLKMPDIPTLPEANYENLKGLTVYAIGDSYFAGEGLSPTKEVWPALMSIKYAQTFVNYGKGGSTVSDYITTNNPMCQRISAMKSGNPDIVLFEGGANDWNHSVPLGTVGSKDTKTFCGAVASCIEQLHAKYPNALIVCISNWEYEQKKNGVETTAFAKAMVDVASQYSYTLQINASDTNVIPAYVANELFRTKYCIASTDKNHLNAEGMKLIFPFFEKIIGEGYKEFKNS